MNYSELFVALVVGIILNYYNSELFAAHVVGILVNYSHDVIRCVFSWYNREFAMYTITTLLAGMVGCTQYKYIQQKLN